MTLLEQPLILDRRRDMTLSKISPSSGINFDAIGCFAQAAWQHDYEGKFRLVYDSAYFRWLLGGNDWTGLLVTGDANEIAGCVFSLYRPLVLCGLTVSATYSLALTVGPDYRGLGLAKWMSDWQRNIVFDGEMQVSFSLFQGGHGGLGAVDTSGRQQGNIGMINFHESAVWTCRLTNFAAPCAEYFADLRCHQLRLSADGSMAGCEDSDTPTGLRSKDDYARWLTSATQMAFLPSKSTSRIYLSENSERSGTRLYPFSTGMCAITYVRTLSALDDVLMGEVAQITLVRDLTVDDQQVSLALRHLCWSLQKDNCLSVSILDQGMISPALLQELGFSASSDRLIFSLRGRPATLALLPTPKLPVSVDLL